MVEAGVSWGSKATDGYYGSVIRNTVTFEGEYVVCGCWLVLTFSLLPRYHRKLGKVAKVV